MKVYVSIFLLGSLSFGNVFTLFSQSNPLDSLEVLINQKTNNEDHIYLLWKAAEIALSEDSTVSKVHFYTNLLRKLPLVQQDTFAKTRALKMDAHANRIIGNYMLSIGQFENCYQFYSEQKDTSNLAFVTDQLGVMNVFMGRNNKAQKYLIEVYELHKAKGDLQKLAQATNGLAIFYNNTNQENKALERYQEALEMFKKIKDTMGQANVHANMGLTYTDLGQYEKAEYHINMQGKLDSLKQTQWGLGFFHDYLGYLRETQGRYPEAYYSYLTSLNIRKKLSSHYNVTESRISLARVLLQLKRYDEAIVEANEVFENYEKRQSLHQLSGGYELLSKAFEAKKDLKTALSYYKSYKEISDSILNIDMVDKIAEMDAVFERAQKEKDIAFLSLQNRNSKNTIAQKNKTILYAGLGFLLVSILCIVLYSITRKYLRQKRKLTEIVSEKDILLREIHHRVKNNLQLVSSLLTLQGRSIDNETVQKAINEGKSRIRSMALIHQDLYQKENLTSVNAQQYFKKLCRELFDTYNIAADKVHLIIEIENIQIDVDTLVPLGLITNEIVSNCLKYAFLDNEKGTLTIKLIEESNYLELTISDDGIGYDPEKISKNSFGNRLIHSLTNQLEGKLNITTEKGTTVNIKIYAFKTSKTNG